MAEGLVQLARIGLETMATARLDAVRRAWSRLVAKVDPPLGLGAAWLTVICWHRARCLRWKRRRSGCALWSVPSSRDFVWAGGDGCPRWPSMPSASTPNSGSFK